MLLTAFVSILLHETAHAIAAAACGNPPEEMELTPLGAVLRLDDEERLPPLRRLLMLAAGPAMTSLLCLAAVRFTACGWLPQSAGRMLFLSNMTILLLNLLPALPLDGGRMLFLLLGCVLRPETVRRIARATGTIIGLCAIGSSIVLAWQTGAWNWSLAACGCFLMYAAAQATSTQAMVQLRLLTDRKLRLESHGHLRVRRIAIPAALPLYRAIRLLHPRALTEFLLMEQGTMRIAYVMAEVTLISAWLDRPQITCEEAMQDRS